MRVATAIVGAWILAATSQTPHATLTGLAVLPADTLADGPPSGAWLRADALGAPQFPRQPVQGISALAPRGTHYLALSDNGFGAKLNSADYLLRIYALAVDWQSGEVRVLSHIQLADPDRKLPFPIMRSEGKERWLTGADLDPESFVAMPDGTFWIGDEFGPFLIHVGADGRLLERPYEIPDVRSPDHPHVAPPDAGTSSAAQVGRSRGFEGLAVRDGRLFAALEAGLAAESGETEIHEFDLQQRAFATEPWRYRFEPAGRAITEFVSLSQLGKNCANRFLTIERDNEHGQRATFKRVYEVTLDRPVMAKRPVVDLMSIDNPNKLGGHDVRFTFPFITTEAVWPASLSELVIANDNNFPAGGGRPGAERDATEFIRVGLPVTLCGR